MAWFTKAISDLDQVFKSSNKPSPGKKHMSNATASNGAGSKRAESPDHFTAGQVQWIQTGLAHCFENFGNAIEARIANTDKK
eukprot:447611-Karenia_brevis.AAC.1